MARLPSAPDLASSRPSIAVAGAGGITGPATAAPVRMPEVGVPDVRVSNAESAALARVGAEVGKLGDTIYAVLEKEREHNDTVRAEDAFNQLREKQLDLTLGKENGFSHLRGGDAANRPLVEEWTSRFDEAAKEIAGGLSSPRQVERFRARAAIARTQFQGDILRHSATESDAYAKGVVKSTFDTEMRNVGVAPADDLAAGLSFERVTASVIAEGRRLGKTDEQITVDVGAAKDALWQSRLEAWRLVDPVGALAALQKNALEIRPHVRAQLSESLYRDAAPVLAASLNSSGGPPITATQLARPRPDAPPGAVIDYEKGAAAERVRIESFGGKPIPRGVRNNNPGNIIQSGRKWDGEIEGADPRFASFATPEAGIRALASNLLAYQAKGIETVDAIISRWAPATENNTAAYVAAVAKEIGVDPRAPLNLRDRKTMTALATAIIRHENGAQPYSAETIAAGIESAIAGKPFAYEAKRTPGYAVASIANLTPADALTFVTGNPVIDALPPDQKINVLHIARTQANQGMAQAREALKGRYVDAVSAFERGLDSPNPPSTTELISTFGQFDGERMAAELDLMRQFGKDVKAMTSLPATSQAALLAARAPVPGEGFAAATKRHEALARAADVVAKERAADPALAVMRNAPQVQAAYQTMIAALSGGDPTKTAAAAQAYATATLAEQSRLEISNPRILSKDMIDSIAARFAAPAGNGENVANVMRGMVETWGKYWPAVGRQLGKAIPPEATVIGLGISSEAEALLAETSKLKPEALRQGLEESTVKDVRERVRAAFEPLQKSLAWQSGGVETYDNFADSAEKVALALVQKGMKPKDAAAKAFEGLAGFKYEFDGTWRVPKAALGGSTSVASIRDGAEAIKRDVGSDSPVLGEKVSLLVPAVTTGVRKEDAERMWRETIVSNGFWVTSPGDGGLTLYVKSGLGAQPVLDATGAPVRRTWDQISSIGRSVSAAYYADVYAIPGSLGKRGLR